MHSFRAGYGTSDMVFTVRQLPGKSIEQEMHLYRFFVDLMNVFDSQTKCIRKSISEAWLPAEILYYL